MFPMGKGGKLSRTGQLMNFCDLDQGVETLREPFGLFIGRCCRGWALHCPEVPGCCLRGLVPPDGGAPSPPGPPREERGCSGRGWQ